jgi:hypothetical protein
MTTQYRLCFNPAFDRKFETREEFASWCEANIPAEFEYRSGGLMILPWHETPNCPGTLCWSILMDDQLSCRDGEVAIITFLRDHDWTLDGIPVLFYAKHSPENAYLYNPIQ